jgi:hypothetical protein
MIASLLVALLAGPAPATATVALLPLENVSGDERAGRDVAAVLARALTARGYTVVQGEAVEAALEAERVRYLDSLSASVRAKVATQLGAAYLVSGAVYAYLDGPDPMLAFSGRMVGDDGASRWGGVFGLRAADTEGLFGAGRAATLDALLRVFAERVARSLPAPNEGAAPARGAGKPLHLAKPRAVAAAALGLVQTRRLAVLPPECFADDVRAGTIVTHLLAIRLRDAGFEPVEPADLREAMRAEGVRSFRALDSGFLARIGERIGTTLFVSGSVYAWRDTSRNAAVPPEVSLELSLVDVAAGRVLWTGQHARSGADYAFLLQRGAVTSAVALADRAIAELLDNLRAGRPAARANAASSRKP